MCELGWKSLGVLELTALPSIDTERWVPWVLETDVLLVNGGDALYLHHWMRQSGLADLLPSLHETVWVGPERREHGDDPPRRGGLRRVEAAHR
jgi:dipeptidase E